MTGAARMSLALKISGALAAAKIDAVLVGGSVVSIYTGEGYVSDGLDFVSSRPLASIAPVMATIGFEMTGNLATHPDHELFVQFCPPPLVVGRQPIVTVKLRTSRGVLETLSPTDCVLDRLVSWFTLSDPQDLDHAVLVAQRHEIDQERIREVSRLEGRLNQLDQFLRRLT